MKTSKYFTLTTMALLIISSASLFAQQAGLWTGVSDDSWGNFQNWDDGIVPDNVDDVVIPAACANYPQIDKILVVGSAFVGGDKYRCKSLTINVGGQIISGDSLEVNGSMIISGMYLYDEDFVSGTHVINNGGSIVVNATGSFWAGQYGSIPNLKQDLIINSGGSFTTSGYVNINDCLILNSGATFNMTGGITYVMGYEAGYNSSYPASFYVPAGVIGGVSAGEFFLQGKEVTGYHALTINEPGFDFTGTSHLHLYIEPDQGAPYPDYSVYLVDGVSFNDVTVNNQGAVTTINCNMQVDNDFTVENPSCLTLVSGKTLTVLNDFLLKSDLLLGYDFYSSFLEVGQLIVGGTSKVQWAVEGNRYHLISSPVSGETANIFNGMYMLEYIESSNSWSWITSLSQALTVMQGFALWFNASWWQTVYFTGTVNTGNIGSDNNLTKTSYGWNLVANPYPSAINWDASTGWTKTNVNNAIYSEHNGNWATYINGVGTNGGSKYIAPCHGFLVQANAHPGTLKMSNSVREHKKPIYMKTTNVIRLTAYTTDTTIITRSDETIIRINPNSTTGFDGAYDAHKLFASDTLFPQIYSSSADLSVNTIPTATSENLKFSAGIPGFYKLAATETGGVNYLLLKDLFTGSETNLLTNEYVFQYDTADSENRFLLNLSPVTSDQLVNPNEEQIGIRCSGKQVHITISDDLLVKGNHPTAKVFDMSGKLLGTQQLKNQRYNSFPLNENGIVVVLVSSNGYSASKPVFVNAF
jgi:hypothetical protein